MSRTVDERVVSMEFDNSRFEKNVSTSLSTLDKLKRALRLDGAAKGLEEINTTAERIDMSGIGNAVETVRAKFSALEVIGVTALANIANSAINTGKQLAKSLSVDQIAAGWGKYAQKTASVQTIMNSTGMSIDEVNKVLNQLMWYSDETSYGFTDMTAALAQMTSSGGDVKNLIPLITGVANATAFAGKGATEFSRAMYNLNQSYGSGYLQYMDWKSLELAGVAGKDLKQVFIDTAVEMGKIKEGEVTLANFSQTLKDKWADTEVMEKAFGKFSELSQEAYKLVEAGEYDTASEAIKALSGKYGELAERAFKSAQEAKSFTEAIDATKDAVSSGWLKTFEIIFGNYEEAKVLWTDLADRLWDTFASGADSRNEMLQGWKDLGGRDDLIESFWNAWDAVGKIITPLKEAFRDIFPATTAEQLASITSKLKDFTEKLKISDETAEKIKRTFKGVFSIFDMAKKVIMALLKPIGQLIGSEGVGSLATLFLDAAAAIGDFFTKINEGFDTTDISGSFTKIIGTISDVLKGATTGIKSFGDIFVNIGEAICTVAGKLWEAFKNVFGFIVDNVSFTDIFAGLASGGIVVAAKKLMGFLDNIKETLGGKGIIGLLFGNKDSEKDDEKITDKFKNILGSVNETLQSFTNGIKVASVVAIAIAIGILSSSLRKISEINAPNLIKSLTAIGIMMTMLSKTLKSMLKSIKTFDSKGIVKTSFALILIASALNVLGSAIKKIGELPFGQIVKGLIGIGGGLFILTKGINAIKDAKIPLKTSISIIALAKACDMLGDALKKFGEMAWNEIGRGLVSMGSALGELVAAVSVLNKFGGGKSIFGALAIDIVILGLSKLADALKSFGEMNWDQIGRGLAAMGGALAEVSIAVTAVGKIAGFSGIIGGTAIDIVISGLGTLAKALKSFAEMTWDEITRGLEAMGGSLLQVGIAVTAVGKIAGFSGIFGGAAIDIVIAGLNTLADALKKFGGMSWDQIKRGLTAMGGALTEVLIFSGALGKIAGFSAVIGGAAIDIVIAGLNVLADALNKFGSMSWDQIKQGLVAMGGALIEVSLFSGALGLIAGFSGILGGAAIWTTVQGLGDLADALAKFGSMSWEEIDRGLVAMGNSLAQIAAGGFLNTLAIIGSFAIAEMAKPLGDLADSVKKWTGVEVPEGLGAKLISLAAGVEAFTFGGFGASAIATVASPIGTLADSIKKWKDVKIPEELTSRLGLLSSAIGNFTYSGWGADALATVAAPIGTLAESIKKWGNVKVPDKIEEQLTGIAEGIKSFTWGFAGGWSISSLIQPLSDLPGAISKWNSVTVPENIQADLTSVAKGVKEFTFGFAGGWTISSLIDPLTKLPEAFDGWSSIDIPDTIKDDLTSVANGIKEFSFMWGADTNFANVTGPMKELASALVTWGSITLSETIETDLKAISSGIKSFSDVGDISTTIANISLLTNSMTMLSGSNLYGVADGLTYLINALNGLSSDSSSIVQLGTNIINGIVNGINSGIGQVQTSMAMLLLVISSSSQAFYTAGMTLMQGFAIAISSQSSIIISRINILITQMISTISSKIKIFNALGRNLILNFTVGILSGTGTVYAVVRGMMETISSTISSYSFYDLGVSLVDGFAAGITAETFAAEAAARAMAQAAYNAAKEELDINSPSKVFRSLAYAVPEGFAAGIDKMGGLVKDSAVGMAQTAIESTKNAISKIGSVVSSDMDVQPTIRPVVDLNNFNTETMQLGANIDTSFTRPISSLSQMIASAQDDIYASNNEVIAAINDLRADINAIYSGDDQEIALYVDSKKLATSLAKPMNRQLNILSKKGAY